MPDSVYRNGDHGPAVAQIREHLAHLGLLADEPSEPRGAALVDASFDDDVERAVRAFQQQRGLIADGIVGDATWRCLDDARWQLGDRVLRYPRGPFMIEGREPRLAPQPELGEANRRGLEWASRDADRGFEQAFKSERGASAGMTTVAATPATWRLRLSLGLLSDPAVPGAGSFRSAALPA